ncbi:KilA-N domain-containing protein [Halomonas sp. 3H]|uniref:KilA-N domain-containing protein n=1 Tax=Halomonas sp. 3H TaxID=2952527 RepID=UPI0020B86108|nr:KilA-N domain-containing protein [Halomonas sp. 3H]
MTPSNLDTIRIRRDEHGRYNLNDLHNAAMASGKATKSQRPGAFLQSGNVQAFLSALSDATKIASVVTIRGGKGQGTYGVELVCTRYAAWIDPMFEVEVYMAFQTARQAQLESARHEAWFVAARQRARLEAPFLADALKEARKAEGKETKPYVFSNEHDLINRIVLGCSAKKCREQHGLLPGASIRDHIKPDEVEAIAYLQHIDAGLVAAGLSFKERQGRLAEIYQRRKATRVVGEAA